MARRRYQKGSLRKRGKRTPVWELQWWKDYIRDDGSIGRRRESLILGSASTTTKRQARKAAEEKPRALNQGKVSPHAILELRDFVERYFIPNFLPTLKASTQKRYRTTLNTHLLPVFGKQRLCDISSFVIQNFVLRKMESGLSWESAHHFRNLMSRLFAMAKQWGYYAGNNPAEGVLLPEKKPVREKHVLSPEQIARLLMSLPEPSRTMFLLGVLTGLRIGEMLGLRWKDVRFDSGEIRVEQTCYRGSFGTPKTKASRRTIPLPDVLRVPLMRIRGKQTVQTEDSLVFQTRNGTPYSDTNLLHKQLKPVGRNLGMPWLSWHVLRRTHATLLQASGASLRDAQAQLGHTKMSTTLEIYTLPIPAHQRAAVERLSQLVTNGDELHQFREALPGPTEQIQ
jgi:integrase